jgi:YVTN family beta-propeller protein
LLSGSCLALFTASASLAAGAPIRPLQVYGSDGNPALLPTGQYITPTIAAGSSYQRLATGLRPDGNADADSAMSSAVSPDGKTLLVLTSGFNTGFAYQVASGAAPDPINFPALFPLTGLAAPLSVLAKTVNGANQSEGIFIYDISTGVAIKKQIIPIRNAYNGIAWDPTADRFYVSGGIDDRIAVYKNSVSKPGHVYKPDAPFIILNHNADGTAPISDYHGGSLANSPVGKSLFGPALTPAATVAGFDVSRDGKTIVAANFHNASASLVDTTTRSVIKDVVFTAPGSMTPIGEMPFWVAVKSNAAGAYAKAYITSERDDQVVVLTGGSISAVIPVPSGPNKAILDAAQRYLYVACGNDDSLAKIDTVTDTIVGRASIARPGDVYKGATPDALAIGANGTRLYVTLGGENAVAVVDLRTGRVLGRIPTGWYPTSVSLSNDGKHLFVVNEKSNAGPNRGNRYYAWNTAYGAASNPTWRNEYTWELEKSGLLSTPVPEDGSLPYLSGIVDVNNNFSNRHDTAMMKYLRTKIKHVIYIVNENRTFDQVLGDLGNGSNGDPRLTFFTQPITPNLHALAANFVTLDNFYDSSETSGVGWNWVMQGHTNDYVEKTQPVDYGNGADGFTYDWQGIVNNMNLGLPPVGSASIFQTRITGVLDPSGRSTILPGYRDPSATVGADNLAANAVGGYIWESVLRKYGPNSVRNYGWQIDLNMYSYPAALSPPPLVRNPFSTHTLESAASTPSIRPVTDPYYRAFDQNYPDIFRIEEWTREFNAFVANKNLPSLEVMTIPHDHTGSLGTAIEGLGTPQLELADHDYAIGKLVEAVSNSPYWASTAIVMLEDDPQDGQDHVDAHRSIIHIISPYSQKVGIVHTTYFSTSALRTVEDLLGVNYLGFNDANALPIVDAFKTTPDLTKYAAIIPGSLCAAPVSSDLVPACKNPAAARTPRVADLHDRAWWSKATAGLDFSKPDHIDPQYYNQILEYGITGRGSLPVKSALAVSSKDYDKNDGDGDGK